ncbi:MULTISPECIES: hypothetical protein [Psychrobacter]|uniref:hypothetical protein n=1 Tax=Psychrobacter TaxID=497 RepID=UPI000EC6B663|nr:MULTISPECIES: hypothetical protein [Psychrobacter]HCH26973.1 hypothetical protein [Psychrobacter sp.]
MDIKKIVVIAALALLAIIGYNYYSSAQSEKARTARIAETEAMKSRLVQAEIEKANKVEAEKSRIELEAMPEKAQKIIADKESEIQPDTQYTSIDLEKEDRAKLDEIMRRWSDASIVAGSTARIALSPAVKDLQSIRREAEKLIVTPCLTRAQANMLVGMDAEILGYIKFMGDAKADITKDMIDKYEAHAKYFEIIKKCTD